MWHGFQIYLIDIKMEAPFDYHLSVSPTLFLLYSRLKWDGLALCEWCSKNTILSSNVAVERAFCLAN